MFLPSEDISSKNNYLQRDYRAQMLQVDTPKGTHHLYFARKFYFMSQQFWFCPKVQGPIGCLCSYGLHARYFHTLHARYIFTRYVHTHNISTRSLHARISLYAYRTNTHSFFPFPDLHPSSNSNDEKSKGYLTLLQGQNFQLHEIFACSLRSDWCFCSGLPTPKIYDSSLLF